MRKAVAETIGYLNANSGYVGGCDVAEYDAVRPHGCPNSPISWMRQYRSLTGYEKGVERRTNEPEWSRMVEPVRQTVDLDGITTQSLGGLDA